jgi:hypothetical protein
MGQNRTPPKRTRGSKTQAQETLALPANKKAALSGAAFDRYLFTITIYSSRNGLNLII